MKKLLIVESPAKIKTISKFLGKDFKIMSTIGHIKDLPQKELGVHVNKHITIDYQVLPDKEKVIADICKTASAAEAIFLAPDPDREGEIIAWHIQQEVEKTAKNKNNIFRITFNEITQPAIQQALEHPSKVDMKKVAAQQARRVLDRWVGYEVSPILWRKLKKGLSAGRVQSVALKLICDREEDIQVFKPEEYWTIHALFGFDKEQFEAPLTLIGKKKPEIANKKQAQEVIGQIKKQTTFIVESITDKKRIKNPYPPFMTSSLQQAAYNRLGFNVKKTMDLAQKLYEGMPLQDKTTPVALITYMRTDSLRISDTASKQVRNYIDSTYGKEYLPKKTLVYSKGKAQDAHEAIRPIDIAITPTIAKKHLPADAAKLYELIWRRFVACQMEQAVYAQRQVIITGGKFTFKITGSTLIFDGFLKVYEEDEKEEKIVIPSGLKENLQLELEKIDPKQHFTQPPPRYTEGSLVKELEKLGIGRPSTYAAILNTIRAREYTQLDPKKRFVPTELGRTVTKMLTENLPKIINTQFTALMEEDLDKIAQGQLDRDQLLHEFYKTFEKDLETFAGEQARRPTEPTGLKCPECGNDLIIRFGKSGHFIGCSNYPECTFTSNFIRKEDGSIELVKMEGPKLLEETCPQCGKQLRQMVGKFGPFIACSGYPECKYIAQTKAPFKCHLDKGDVVKKQWKGGIFWGCANYPQCKFVIFGDIEPVACPNCKTPYLLKKYDKNGNVTLQCTNKECGYKSE